MTLYTIGWNLGNEGRGGEGEEEGERDRERESEGGSQIIFGLILKT